MMDTMDNELRSIFLEEADELLAQAETALLVLEGDNRNPEAINRIFRLAHNFKGSARTVGFHALSSFAHKLEDVLSAIKKGHLQANSSVISLLLQSLDALAHCLKELRADSSFIFQKHELAFELEQLVHGPKETLPSSADSGFHLFTDEETAVSDLALRPKPVIHTPVKETRAKSEKGDLESLRVPSAKIDQLLNLVGEMVVNQSIVNSYWQNKGLPHETARAVSTYMDKLVKEVQDVSMSLRMVPVKPLFQKLKRTVRDAAEQLNKNIDIQMIGDHVELDKTILDRITDPLNHMVRNAVDHGIEDSDERAATNKRAVATIRVEAIHQEEKVALKVSDDGRGLDSEKIRAKAIKSGLIQPQATLSEAEIFRLIFKPGFSTKEVVTDISGRGVGMEVVSQVIEDLKGTIEIDSRSGKGTTFVLSIPLSMSIVGGLIVKVNENKIVIPISQLIETVELGKLRIETTTGSGKIVDLRGEAVPILSMRQIFRMKKPQEKDPKFHLGIVTSHQGKRVIFEIDEIIGQQQVVLKKLGREMQGLPGIISGSILSSGEPALVINLQELLAKGQKNVA